MLSVATTQSSPISGPKNEPNSRRCLDLYSATAIVAASMIGAGVYTTSGFSMGSADSPWTVVTAWCIGGLVAICGAIGYAALASRFTESGGEYFFLSRTIHPMAGVMAGWVSVLAGFTGPIAAAALALEVYVGDATDRWGNPPSGAIAAIVIFAAAGLHTASVRPSARAQDLVVALKLLLWLVVIGVAACVPVSDWRGLDVAVDAPEFAWAAFATSLLYISFSYSGFNAAIYIAGEVRDSHRNVPRAMILGTIMV
ncbi:MAG: APC family permease, partial [Planctomycetota bacterium]